MVSFQNTNYLSESLSAFLSKTIHNFSIMGNITRKKKINLRRKKDMDSEDQNNRHTITTHH